MDTLAERHRDSMKAYRDCTRYARRCRLAGDTEAAAHYMSRARSHRATARVYSLGGK